MTTLALLFIGFALLCVAASIMTLGNRITNVVLYPNEFRAYEKRARIWPFNKSGDMHGD